MPAAAPLHEAAIHCTLPELLALRAPASAIELVASPRRARDAGASPSRLRGRGIEFEEVRA